MSLQRVFVDFDETLFGHYDYLKWFDHELDMQGILPGGPGSFAATIDKYHDVRSTRPLLRLYKHAEHLADTTGKDWQFVSGEMEQKVAMQHVEFCYPDSHDFLEWLKQQPYDSRILTYGDGEYQRFKIGLCLGDVTSFPIHVTDIPKADFLAAQFPDGSGVLIDDKHPLDLPKNWQHIWITRSEKLKKPQKIADRVYQVNSLEQAKQLIPQL